MIAYVDSGHDIRSVDCSQRVMSRVSSGTLRGVSEALHLRREANRHGVHLGVSLVIRKEQTTRNYYQLDQMPGSWPGFVAPHSS